MFLEVVGAPGPAGPREQQGQGLGDFAVVGLAAGGSWLQQEVNSSMRPIRGWVCMLALSLESSIEAIQGTAASLCQQTLPLENMFFKASFNCKII